jgi:hypothetical protein
MIRLLLTGMLAASGVLAGVAAPLPACVRTALDRLRTDGPADRAYVVVTRKGDVESVESYDPGRPAGDRWQLERHRGQPPSARDAARYREEKARDPAPPGHATFDKSAVDRGSGTVVREDSQVVVARFRFAGDGRDKLLEHLELELTVAKDAAAVLRYELRLTAPFTPVLGVKFLELHAGTSFCPPGSADAGLPQQTISRFRGRIFFKSVEENLELTYRDYGPASPAP